MKRGRRLHQTRARRMAAYWPGLHWMGYASRISFRDRMIADLCRPSKLLDLLPLKPPERRVAPASPFDALYQPGRPPITSAPTR